MGKKLNHGQLCSSHTFGVEEPRPILCVLEVTAPKGTIHDISAWGHRRPRPLPLIPSGPHPAPEHQPVSFTFHASQQQGCLQYVTEQENRTALHPKSWGFQTCLCGGFGDRVGSACEPHYQPGCTAGVRRGKVGQRKLHPLLTSGKPSPAEPGAPLGDNALIPSPTSGMQSSFSAFLQTRVLPDHITSQAFPVRASSNLSSLTKAFS